MTCPQCGREAPPSVSFCGACGAALHRACPACGARNPLTHRFCDGCGGPLDGSTRFGPPRTYTPAHLADRIRVDRASFEGERKQVSVLFADLKASMELLARADPEEARRLLDPVLERMMDAVHHYEGTVNQVMGDGIMALFGAPVALEDHAPRACYAALRMLGEVARHAAEIRRTHGIDLQIRVGLNAGEVLIRAIRSDLTTELGAVGRVVHLAARMEQLAHPGTALLPAEMARLVADYVELRARGPVPVKGLESPVEVFELTGRRRARSRLEAAAARGLTRLVGRAPEVAALERAAALAAAGRGQLAALCGEAGVGKSRLVHEFTRGRLGPEWHVVETAAAAHGRGVPYLAVASLVAALFQIDEGDDAAKARERVTGRLLALDEHRPATLLPLLDLLDASEPGSDWEAIDPPQRRRQIIEAVERVLVRESRLAPLCVVFEDLHFLDPESQAVLAVLVDRLPGARLLLLVTYRPEYTHPWGGRTYYVQIGVPLLGPAAAGELFRALTGSDPSLAALEPPLVARSEGNPFFLEESVRHLAEQGVLAGAPGAYRLTRPAQELDIPASVHAVLAARVDRLPPAEKWILQTAAAIGREVPLGLLAAVAGLPAEVLRRGLHHLREVELLEERDLFPDIRYAFRHLLIQEVVYEGLMRESRRALDAQIVEAIERTHAERREEQSDRLAHHAFRGEVWDKAAAYCRAAGRRALGRSAHRAAAAYFDQALAAAGRLPEGRQRAEAAIDLHLDLRLALSPLGEYRRMRQQLAEAEALAASIGDRRRMGLVAAFLTNFHTLRGEFDQAIGYGLRAQALADEAGDLSLRVLVHAVRAMAFYGAGSFPEAVDAARRNTELLAGDLALDRLDMAQLPSVYSRTVMAWSLAELGELDRAERVAEEALALAERAEHPHSLIFACMGLGLVCLRRGDPARAVTALERGRELCRTAELPAVFLELALPLGSAYARAGRTAEAIAHLEQAIAEAVALRHPLGHWLRSGGLAEAYLRAGRAAEALPLAHLFAEITRMVNTRGSRAWALCLCGDVEAAQDPPHAAEAEAAYREALGLARELRMRPLEAQCAQGLGDLCRRLGRAEEAREHHAAASAACRALGITAVAPAAPGG